MAFKFGAVEAVLGHMAKLAAESPIIYT